MINRKTVLVLGAGASQPYGFPTGYELKNLLSYPDGQANTPSFNWLETLAKHGLHDQSQLRTFSVSLRNSAINSIDSYLFRKPTSDKYKETGTQAMAAILLNRELNTTFWLSPIQDDWYTYLWNQLIKDVHTPTQLLLNQIAIVTFNYDRSLEMFLIYACSETFQISPDQAVETIKKLQIIHVYGSLGEFILNYGEQGMLYGADVTGDNIVKAAASIQIMHQDRESNNKAFDQAQQQMYLAEKIAFLGYGFDTINNRRLNLKRIFELLFESPAHHFPEVIISSYGRTDAEMEETKRELNFPTHWQTYPAKNLDTLRLSGALLGQR